MNKDQRLKLAKALSTEALVSFKKKDTKEGKYLLELAVKTEYKYDIQRIIKGDVDLFKMTFKNMYSNHFGEKLISRIIMNMLVVNEDFRKTFEEKYIHFKDELSAFEKTQIDDEDIVPPFDRWLW